MENGMKRVIPTPSPARAPQSDALAKGDPLTWAFDCNNIFHAPTA